MVDQSNAANSISGFGDRDITSIKKAAAFVLENFNNGPGIETMESAHARWPDLPERAWPVVMIAVEVALEYRLNRELAAIDDERF